MLHAVRRRQNALTVMQMAKTADKLREQNVHYVRGYWQICFHQTLGDEQG